MAICGLVASSQALLHPIYRTLDALRIDAAKSCSGLQRNCASFAGCDDASLSEGHGDRVAAFDGRIDNREELHRALGIGATENASASTLVLRAYLAWGNAFCRHIIGDYSCAIWDSPSRQLLLATDPGAMRPLFYRATEKQVLFASEQRGILADPTVS